MKKAFYMLAFCLVFALGGFAQNPGDGIFNSGQLIHNIRITFPTNSWYDTLTHYYTVSDQLDSNIYLMATSVEFDGVVYDSVGCKFKGNSSYNNNSDKKSWKLSFEEFKNDNKPDGLKQLNLNNGFKDPTLLREKLCLDFLRYYNAPAPRADYANVYVNNQLWGFYILVEEVDKTFAKTRFGNKSGNMFKGDPHGDLRWKGANANMYYGDYELKTNEDVNDWSDLLWLIDNINNSSTTEFRDSLNGCLNTASFIKCWATTILFVNLDSYSGSGHNYYIYHDVDSNRFEWINWDVNEAFGVFINNVPTNQLETLPMNYIPSPQTNRPLTMKMSQDSIYWQQYENFMCNALNDYFNPTHMGYLIDSLHNRIKADAYADPRKFFPNNQFDSNIDTDMGPTFGLKPFVQTRYTYLTQQLDSFNCTPLVSSVNEVTKPAAVFHLFPNPTSAGITVSGNALFDKIEVYDLGGRLVLSVKQAPINSASFSVDHLSPRSYVLSVVKENVVIFRGKVIKL